VNPRAFIFPSRNLWAIGLGLWASAVALAPSSTAKLALVAPLLLAALFCWTILHPSRWIVTFFFCLLLLPPFPFSVGNSGAHVAPLFAGLGILASIIWAREWRSWSHPLSIAFGVFLLVLLESTALAALYSGWEIALGSLARVILFAIGIFVFIYAYAGPTRHDWNDFRIARLLFWMAVAAALFACVDFQFQLPAPAGYGDQFIWLQEGVFRRAQGLFYEASTLGNFCAFFLVMVVVSLLRSRGQAPCSRPALLFGGLVLSAALVFSYSRGSVINLVVACLVIACLRLRRLNRALLVMLGTLVVAGFALQVALPSFSANYWDRLMGGFGAFWLAPNAALSGRVGHWQVLLDFLAREPWHALLGVGYKTLPYSNFVGSTVVADNTYLELLVETGVVGIGAFLALNALILRTGWRALRSAQPATSFLGEWIFAFWCGQTVQMLSGDLITYWRVLPVYFWVLGAAARQTREAP